tara:strand:+ start:182 stop:484 length:303 start_codon:yes stop_codon:yes gene_type:complete
MGYTPFKMKGPSLYRSPNKKFKNVSKKVSKAMKDAEKGYSTLDLGDKLEISRNKLRKDKKGRDATEIKTRRFYDKETDRWIYHGTGDGFFKVDIKGKKGK